MLFSEVYGSYYSAVAQILSKAVDGSLTGKELSAVVQETAFGESILTIPASLKEERWPLLDQNYQTFIQHSPVMPLTALEKRWLKTLLQDPRIKLFAPSITGLEDIEPLYERNTIVYYDQYTDGDPFEDEEYISHFRTILQAMKEKRKIRIRFNGSSKVRHKYVCVPYKLEYSAKDDKFRLITSYNGYMLTVNIGRIRSVHLLEPYTEEEFKPVEYREEPLVMELTNERNALERVMLHFSDLEKETEKLDDRHYRITLHSKKDDETEIMIRILSFGPVLKVLSPASLVSQIRQRLDRQFRYQPEL